MSRLVRLTGASVLPKRAAASPGSQTTSSTLSAPGKFHDTLEFARRAEPPVGDVLSCAKSESLAEIAVELGATSECKTTIELIVARVCSMKTLKES